MSLNAIGAALLLFFAGAMNCLKNRPLLLIAVVLGGLMFVPSVSKAHAFTGFVCLTSPDAIVCPTSPPALGPFRVGTRFTVGVLVQDSSPMAGFDIYVESDPAVVNPTGASLGTLIVNPILTDICVNGLAQIGSCTVNSANRPGVVEVSTIENSGANECGGSPLCSGMAFFVNYTVVGSAIDTSLSFPTSAYCNPSSVPSPPDVCVVVADNFGTLLPENIQAGTVVQSSSPDFTIVAIPNSLTVNASSSGASSIILTSVNGLTGTVVFNTTLPFSCLTCPTWRMEPATIRLPSGGSNSSRLTFYANSFTPPGPWNIIVTASLGNVSHSTSAFIRVRAMVTVFTSPNAQFNGEFGDSVAVSGNIVVIGAPFETIYTDAGPVIGGAYIFDTSGRLIATLTSANAHGSGEFGYSVAVSGNLVVVGAPVETVAGHFWAGRAYVFSTAGVRIATLTSTNPQVLGLFGSSVAVGGDKIVVGAPFENDGGNSRAGNSYLFVTRGSAVTKTIVLHSPNSQSDGGFGWSVAIGGAAYSRVVVGARDESAAGLAGAGNAYIYNDAGHAVAALSSISPQTEGGFGSTVAASSNILAIGARDEGRVYVLSITGSPITTLVDPNPPANPQSSGGFGYSIAVSNNNIVVGDRTGDSTGLFYSGDAYVFSNSGTLIATLTSPKPSSFGFFGTSVSISSNSVLVGAEGEIEGGIIQGLVEGNAYLFAVPVAAT